MLSYVTGHFINLPASIVGLYYTFVKFQYNTECFYAVISVSCLVKVFLGNMQYRQVLALSSET